MIVKPNLFYSDHHAFEDYQLDLVPGLREKDLNPFTDYQISEKPYNDDPMLVSQFL
jgi:hypothetical protein